MYMESHPISDKNKLASAADGDRILAYLKPKISHRISRCTMQCTSNVQPLEDSWKYDNIRSNEFCPCSEKNTLSNLKSRTWTQIESSRHCQNSIHKENQWWYLVPAFPTCCRKEEATGLFTFFCPSPLPFGGSTVLSLTRGPAGIEPPPAVCQRHKSAAIPLHHEDDCSNLNSAYQSQIIWRWYSAKSQQRNVMRSFTSLSTINRTKYEVACMQLISQCPLMYIFTPLFRWEVSMGTFLSRTCAVHMQCTWRPIPFQTKHKLASAADGDRTWRIWNRKISHRRTWTQIESSRHCQNSIHKENQCDTSFQHSQHVRKEEATGLFTFFCPSPLPFGGSTVLSLTRGPAGNRTTTGSLSATQSAAMPLSHEDDWQPDYTENVWVRRICQRHKRAAIPAALKGSFKMELPEKVKGAQEKASRKRLSGAWGGAWDRLKRAFKRGNEG